MSDTAPSDAAADAIVKRLRLELEEVVALIRRPRRPTGPPARPAPAPQSGV